MPCIFISWSNKAPLMSLSSRHQVLLPGAGILALEFVSYTSEIYPKFAILQNTKSFLQRYWEQRNDYVKFISLYFKRNVTGWCITSLPFSDFKYFGQWLFIIFPHFFVLPYCWSYCSYFWNPANVRKMQLIMKNA